ncbi:hypothetical protein RHMOL_Rhmol05G0131900 [Rhododendron molle]|uniref:Uncharacterized protein n=1 Tax=Rhododendron molle TaxID=49168 RepID=A0ACC0NQ17_RHOML|nr:hypothetical protein RHMOL_Rhmol05G0131900 [Rhododendron molle]
MDPHRNDMPGGFPPSSSPSTTSSSPNPTSSHHHHHHDTTNNNNGHNNHQQQQQDPDPMHSWYESVSKARSRIHLLSSLLPPTLSPPLSSLADDSDNPALSLLSSHPTYSALSSSLSGSPHDPLCHWLYDTYLSSDPHLRLVVLSFVPTLSNLYLSLLHSLSSDSPTSSSLAGFEAVLLSLYSAETKSRNGKPLLVSIPDLSLPSLYHTPRRSSSDKPNPNPYSTKPNPNPRPSVGLISPPLEPQTAVRSTKRATIVGVALDCYYKQISQMPAWSKLDFCRFAADWAGQDCPCKSEFDGPDEIAEEMGDLEISENGSGGGPSGAKGARIPLPWEILQPVLRILGHCLLAPLNVEEVRDSASVAVRCLYARASHELVPQAILATRSLIQLNKRARESARAATAAAAAAANVGSNSNTPTKAKKPEILLMSK